MFKKSNRTLFLALAITAAALAGCSGSGSKESASSMPGSESGLNANGNGAGATGNGQSLSSSAAPEQHSVYFAFDKSNINSQYQDVLGSWSKYLLANPSVKVQLQGNCDERGTAAYNMALGERRANAVEQALETDGVSGSQLSTISYGKERPVCTQHDEACWKQNRRADIVPQ